MTWSPRSWPRSSCMVFGGRCSERKSKADGTVPAAWYTTVATTAGRLPFSLHDGIAAAGDLNMDFGFAKGKLQSAAALPLHEEQQDQQREDRQADISAPHPDALGEEGVVREVVIPLELGPGVKRPR